MDQWTIRFEFSGETSTESILLIKWMDTSEYDLRNHYKSHLDQKARIMIHDNNGDLVMKMHARNVINSIQYLKNRIHTMLDIYSVRTCNTIKW